MSTTLSSSSSSSSLLAAPSQQQPHVPTSSSSSGGGGGTTRIGELRPGLHGLRCEFIVIEKLPSRPTNDGTTIHSFHVADATACIIFNIWGVQGEAIEPADIFVLYDGYSSLFRDQLTLYMSKRGRIERTGRFTMVYAEQPNMSMFPARAYETMPPPPFIPSISAMSQQPVLIPPPSSSAPSSSASAQNSGDAGVGVSVAGKKKPPTGMRPRQ